MTVATQDVISLLKQINVAQKLCSYRYASVFFSTLVSKKE